ncbi:MAG: kinase [Candidatus Omnitrophota bacterium]|nr:kinase [Candidatus Omnitrophota bacterium]
MIVSRTPFRISFFGGGTDYPAWYRKYGGMVLGSTIDKFCYISCRYLPPFFDFKHRIVYSQIDSVNEVKDIKHPAVRGILNTMDVKNGLEIHHDGDLPARSGLGSSSSFTVGLIHAIHALKGQMISKKDLATEAVHMEQDILKEHVGSQDQVLTTHGGLNVIQFHADDSFDITPLILAKDRIEDFQKHMMLVFTGFTRIASEIAKHHIANMEARKREMQIMQQMAKEGMEILINPKIPIENFGKLLHEYWQYKRSLSDKVTTPALDTIYEAAKSAGAYGGKLLGAGGGGFMLLFARPDRQPEIREKLKDLIHVNFRLDFTGSKIVIYEPNNFQ